MNKEKSRGYPGKSYPKTQAEINLMSRKWDPDELEARDREIIQPIQSRCIHRRLGIVKNTDIFYCQDCEKILYGKEAK